MRADCLAKHTDVARPRVLRSRYRSGRNNRACKPLEKRLSSSGGKPLQTQAHCWADLDSFRNLKGYYIITFTFSRSFGPKPLTVIHTYIHILMAVAANEHIRSSLGFSIFLKDALHADQGSWTSNLQITRCWLYTWSTAAPSKGDHSISRSNSCLRDMFHDGLNTHTASSC